MTYKLLTILLLAPMWISASAATYFSAGPLSDRFPDNLSTANKAGLTPLETGYKHGFTTEGWTVEAVDASSYSFVAPTYTGEAIPAESWLTTAPFTVEAAGAWLRWNAKSVLPGFPEAYDVVVTETGSQEQATIASVEGEEYQWQTRLASLDDFVGKEVTVSFVCRSTDKYMLAIKEIFAGDFSKSEWTVANRSRRYASVANGAVAAGSITNVGATMEGVSIVCLIGDEETSIEMEGEWNTAESVDFIFNLPLSLNEYTSYSIGIKDKSGKVTVLTSSDVFASHFERNLLVDEGSGMWCNNCPDGILELDRLKREYHGNIIEVTCHTNDVFALRSYWENLKFYAIPYMMLNRNHATEGSNSKNFTQEYTAPTVAEISLPETVTHDDGSVMLEARVRFAENLDNSTDRYRIGYTVTADIYSPEKESYYQSNSMSFPRSEQYYILPSTIPSMLARFENVAVSDEYAFSGIEGSIPAEIEEMTPYQSSIKVEIPEIARNAESARIVAFILDIESGAVLNAAEATLTDSNGIGMLPSDNELGGFHGQPEYFNLQGVRIKTPSKGFYIVRRGNVINKEFIR